VNSIEDLKRQLEELKAKAALPALSDEEEERAKLRDEIAKAKTKITANEARARTVRDDELFERLEVKYGEMPVRRVDSDAGMIVLRQPSVQKARIFQKLATKGKIGPDEIEDFVKPCVVCPCNDTTLEPDFEKLEEMLERYPLLAAKLCHIADQMATAGAEARGKG
jgi:hypothetical protein